MGEGAAAREDHSLLSALSDRRRRRIAGTSVNAGPISHVGAKKPAPPSALTRRSDAKFKDATPRMRTPSVAAASADNAQAKHRFFVNDEGTRHLPHQRGCEVLRLPRFGVPGVWLPVPPRARVPRPVFRPEAEPVAVDA